MERLVSPLQGWLRQIAEVPTTVLLRKLEYTFYFLFLILATTCFILPFIVDMKMTPLLISAAFSVAYAIGLHFLRFKIYVHFGFLLHSGVFLIFLSAIFFVSEFIKVGIAMIVIGILCGVIIIVFASLGKKVIVNNSRVEQQANQARQNVNALNNNPVVANGQANQPNHVLANGDIHHPNQHLANGPINHPNQDLANGHVNANLGNGNAIPLREEPEDQVVQQMEVDQVD